MSLEIRGRREDRVRAAPAVSCAKCTKQTHTSIQVQRKHSGLPRAMVLRLISRSPGDRLCCHRRPREALASQELDASIGASGPHDFAVRNSRARLAHRRVHRIPHPTFVTIAKRPSLRGAGWRELVALICPTAKAEYFSRWGWTGFGDLPDRLFFSRRATSFVIPGRAKHEPGIHNHDREYGFRARARARPGMTAIIQSKPEIPRLPRVSENDRVHDSRDHPPRNQVSE